MPTSCDHTKCGNTCAPCVCRCPATPPVAQDVRTGCGGRESDGCSGRGAGDGLGALAHGVLGQLAGQLGASGRGAVGTLPGKQWRGCGCPELPWRRQAACMPAEDSVLAPVCLARRPASPAILRGRNAAGRAKKGGAKAPTKQTQHAPKTQAWRWPPVEEVRRERVHDGHRLLGHPEFALQALHDLGDVQWRPGRSGPQPQNKNAGAGALAYALITALPDTGLLGATVRAVRALALLAAATGLLRGLLGLLLDRLLRHFLWAEKEVWDVRWELGRAGVCNWRPKSGGKQSRGGSAHTKRAHNAAATNASAVSTAPSANMGAPG